MTEKMMVDLQPDIPVMVFSANAPNLTVKETKLIMHG
jgi:hypothetical protein